MRLTTLLLPLIIPLSILAAAKNCTLDSVTYLKHPYLFLLDHPVLTHEIDVLCRDIRHFTHFISDVNITHFNQTHPNLDLNATEIADLTQVVANVTAELKTLEGNGTLVTLCNRARDVEDRCWPLVYSHWELNRPECKRAPFQNETEAAGKNATLVKICDKFVDECNKNVTVTKAALDSEADVNLTSTTSTATTATTSTAATTSATASSTSKNAGIRQVGLSGGTFVSIAVVLVGMAMIE